ncbi:hypothetical protein V6N13_055163 [Hibiscus sabdariffa]|uniref:Uncharacterized protein n=1 Tax=Hibiscus sabdariffa TaxID=183260 RepID=A0ABR2DX92_9ROSI
MQPKGYKALRNEEMTTNKGPLNEMSIEHMVRNIEVLTPRFVVATRPEKGKAKVETVDEDIPQNVES